MKNKNKFLIVSLILFSIIPLVSSTNIGVSPATAFFPEVLRGGYAERPIMITADSTSKIFVEASLRGEIADWITLEETKFEIIGGRHQLMVSVTPPSGTPNGNYSGFITIQTPTSTQGSEGYATGIVLPTLDVHVVVQVTDKEAVSCQATNFKVSSVEEGEDIIFYLDVLNTGNIKIFPNIVFDIWNQDLTSIIKQEEVSNNEIIPTQKETFKIKIPSKGLSIGQYWVDVSAVECFMSQTLTFDILEEGALRAYGILERIFANPWAETDEIVPIKISFRNKGEKDLSAKFSGKIMYNNKVVQLLESDVPLDVAIDELSEFEFYFTPRKAGRYVISGRVFYDGKRTYEQSAVVNVTKGKITFTDILKVAAYIILTGLILVLIAKIHKERKLYLSKMRRLKK